mgnify:CR=1 FL=1
MADQAAKGCCRLQDRCRLGFWADAGIIMTFSFCPPWLLTPSSTFRVRVCLVTVLVIAISFTSFA